MAVARGDGCVSLYDADWKPGGHTHGGGGGSSSGSGKKGGGKARPRASSRQEASPLGDGGVPGRLALLGAEQGGHSAAANCVAFVPGSGWQQLLSAGNDRRLLLWNWPVARAAAQAERDAAAEAGGVQDDRRSRSMRQSGGEEGRRTADSSSAEAPDKQKESCPSPLLAAEHKHKRKINWTCSAAVPGCPFGTFVADTGRHITALHLL
jgi:hypothetical protein